MYFQVMPSFPVIPCGQLNNKEKYEIAKTFIEDDDVAKLQNKKLFNWTRVTKAVCPLLVPSQYYLCLFVMPGYESDGTILTKPLNNKQKRLF